MKITKLFNYCPNCGSENHTFIDEHRFDCTQCNFVYYHNMAAAVMVLIENNDSYLFTIRNNNPKKGKLDFPGGFVDPGETAQKAVIRELKEELNLDISENNLTLLDTEANDYIYKNIPYRTLDIIFKTTLPNGAIIKKEDSEITDFLWLKKEEIDLEKIGFKSMKKVVKRYIL